MFACVCLSKAKSSHIVKLKCQGKFLQDQLPTGAEGGGGESHASANSAFFSFFCHEILILATAQIIARGHKKLSLSGYEFRKEAFLANSFGTPLKEPIGPRSQCTPSLVCVFLWGSLIPCDRAAAAAAAVSAISTSRRSSHAGAD